MPELPRGTVTFLYTDIEGSTRLWERDRATMQVALERHTALLTTAIGAHGGSVFKTIGDAVQAAFADPVAAVAAAVAAQRALAAEPWPETGPLRVRMALQRGEAAPSATGDYLAPVLHRLGALLAAGHGGQVLLAAAVHEAVGVRLLEGVSAVSLGTHRLRDLVAAEAIWQLVIPGLPATFPPLKSLEGHPSNLPRQPTALIGREAAIATVRDLLASDGTRLVMLTGPGGVGKTRLALAAAAASSETFPDGVFLVSLAGVADAALLVPTVAAVLGVREGGGLSLDESVRTYLAGKRLLLVLDNLEQLTPFATAAAGIATLLDAAPDLRVLATSRAPLRIRAEQEWPVAPLPIPEPGVPVESEAALAVLAATPAVALFVARARAARATWRLTPANAADVAEIARRLDGVPLAIELAAVRIRVLSPAEILRRLGDALALLEARSGDRPDRQQTLRHTIAWSHDLLDDAEQALFQFLSVFPRGFTLEAAEWVSGEQGEESIPGTNRSLDPRSPIRPSPPSDKQQLTPLTLDLLASLVAKSLVVYEDDEGEAPRYRMLETIREFGLERLAASGREATARYRHAAWALALAERAGPHVTGPDATVWLETIERDHASLRAALSWLVERGEGELLAHLAGVLWTFWKEHAHYSEGRRWLDAALELGLAALAKDRLRVMTGAGAMAWYQGDVAYSRQMSEQALVLAREIGDRAAEAFVLGALAVHASEQGDDVRAIAWFEESVAVAREVGDPDPVVLSLHNLAHQEWQRGQTARAVSRLEEALEVAREHGMGWILPSILVGLGTISTDLGDPVRAIGYFRESIALAQLRGNLGDVIDAVGGLARLAAATGQPEKAVRLFGAADAMRDGLAMALSSTEAAELEPIMNGLRTALGEGVFSAAWSDGRSLSQDDALDEALSLHIQTDESTTPKQGSPRQVADGRG